MLIRAVLATGPELDGRIRRLLKGEDVVLEEAPGEALTDAVTSDACDLAFVARSALPGALRESVASLRGATPCCELVVLQDCENPEERAVLLGAGCFGVVSAELSDAGLGRALSAFLRRRRERLHERLGPLSEAAEAEDEAPPKSAAMRECLARAERAAAADSAVLVLGETGAGKEWVARRIHASSRRASGPFVAVNCAALPESLWESEMFGHERGAFTGADRGRRGPFEIAHGGTLFLDEIGDVPLHLQPKLLRVLEERSIQRLGSDRPVPVDVRLMAATNRDLAGAVEAGTFRADLYYRLAVLTIEVPPLRERREDLADLAATFLGRLRRSFRPHVARLRPEVLRALAAYPWPGNVRELANAIETAMLMTEGEEVGLAALPLRIRVALGRSDASGDVSASRSAPASAGRRPGIDRTLAEALALVVHETEREYLRALLAATGGHLGEVARRAGIAPRSLYNKMRHHGLRKEDFRPSATA